MSGSEANQAGTSDSAKSDDKRELQDLSLNDAEELQAFVAKRKWFEVKLVELEAHEPIYPFVQVDHTSKRHSLEAAADPPDLASHYVLPQIEQVVRWQEERDAVEEEVVAFDGGDLERMKQKTRAVTLVPLTPPSTELVEVTLDLIVVVDRLLTLLRRRSELLELTKLRLRWDELRLSAAEELDGMKAESDLIVVRKCEWLPTGAKPIASGADHLNPDASQSCPSPPPNPPRALNAVPTTPRQRILSLPDTPSPSRRSPSSTSHATPRRAALRIPLLRSQITNLRIRHTNFSTTGLPRVGALLDKMIDIAGPLKGLGGVNGPTDEGQEGDGAVPGELLDAQDELEAQATDVGEHVRWCQQLEAQCTNAEQLHSALLQTFQAASDIVVKLANIAKLDSDSLQPLWAKWKELSTSPPSHINRSDYTSSAPSEETQNIEHEAQIIKILEEARGSAQIELRKGKELLDWLTRLSDQLLIVHRCSNDLAIRETEVVHLLDRITTHDAPTDSLTVPIDHELAADLEKWYLKAISTGKEKPDLFQQSTIAGVKYRAILISPPSCLVGVDTAHHESALTRLNDLHDSSTSKTAQLFKARTQFLRDRQIDMSMTELHNNSFSIRSELASISSKLVDRIELASWKGYHRNESFSVDNINVRLSKLDNAIAVEMIEPLRNLKVLVGDDSRHTETLSVASEHIAWAQTAYQTATRYRGILEQVVAQTKAVDTIHDEGEALVIKLEDPSLATFTLETLKEEIAFWLDGIAKRVPILSPSESDIPTEKETTGDHRSDSSSSQTSSASSSPNAEKSPQLDSTNQAVRHAINSLTAKVSSALEKALSRSGEGVELHDHAPIMELDPQPSGCRPVSVSPPPEVFATSASRDNSHPTTGDHETIESQISGSPVKKTSTPPSYQSSSKQSPLDPNARSLSKQDTLMALHSQVPEVGNAVNPKADPRPRYLSQSGASRQSSLSKTPSQQASSFSTPSTTPISVSGKTKRNNLSRPRYSSRSGIPGRPPTNSSSLFSPPIADPIVIQNKSASLGRASGNLYSSRRAPSISNGLSQYPTSSSINRLGSSTSQREDRILARSSSMKSLSLGRSTSSTPSTGRIISESTASNSRQSRRSSSRFGVPTPTRSARKYVPDPGNKLDVAVGDIVNGFKVHVPIVPIGMTARDEYKDTTGSYWIGAEGRAKLCFCRILRSQMVMVRVGGGWIELSKFLIDHFGGSAIEQSLSSLSLAEQIEETPTNLITPVRPRIASSSSTIARTPELGDGSPQKGGEASGSPLTPLQFIKKASDSPDMRQKEKASLNIGRRSILGKE